MKNLSVKVKGSVLTGKHEGLPFQCIFDQGYDKNPCVIAGAEGMETEYFEMHLQPSTFLPGSKDQNWLRFTRKVSDPESSARPPESILCVIYGADVTTPHTKFSYHDSEGGREMAIEGYKLAGIEEIVVLIENSKTSISIQYVFRGDGNA